MRGRLLFFFIFIFKFGCIELFVLAVLGILFMPNQNQISPIEHFTAIFCRLSLLPRSIFNYHCNALLFKCNIGNFTELSEMCDTIIALGFFETGDTKLTWATVQCSSLGKSSCTWTSQFGLKSCFDPRIKLIRGVSFLVRKRLSRRCLT